MSEAKKRPTATTPARQPKRAAPVTRRKQALRRIQAELTTLSSDLDGILDQIRLKLQARLTAIQDRLTAPTGEGEPAPPLSLPVAEKTLALLSELKIRPERGRMKDLGRVAELLETLHKRLRHDR